MATFATVVNPTRHLVDYLATHAANKLTQAIVAVVTPQYAPQLSDLAKSFPSIKTVGIATDTVPLGTQRSGMSWMALESPLNVTTATPLQQHVPSGPNKWNTSKAAFRLTAPKLDIALPVANTLFNTGLQAAMLTSEGPHQPLEVLHIDIPDLDIKPWSSIRPLIPITPALEITSVTDNMLKTLDNTPAASFLEQAEELATNKHNDVFAEIEGEFIKVVAGGGGLWSPKASMLVLEAPASPRVGQHITFHLATHSLNHDLESQLQSTRGGLVAEVAASPDTLEEQRPFLDYSRDHFLPVFGFGSERGFLVKNDKHSIVGESMHFK